MTRLNETSSLASVNATSTTSTTVRVSGRALEHDSESEHRADHVRAGVAEHQALVQVVAEQSRERADDRRDRDADAVGARDERERHPGQQPDLDRASRRAVEEVREVRRQRDEQRVGDDPHAGRRRTALALTSTTASAPPPTIFTTPGRDASVRERAEMTAETRDRRSSPTRSSNRPSIPKPTHASSTSDTRGVAPGAFPTPNAPNSERPASTSTTASTASRPIAVGHRLVPGGSDARAPARAAGRDPRRRAAGRPARRRRTRAGRSRRKLGGTAGSSRSRPRRSRSDRRGPSAICSSAMTAVSAPCGSSASSKVVTCFASARIAAHGFERGTALGRRRRRRRPRRRPRRARSAPSPRAAPARSRPSCRSPTR